MKDEAIFDKNFDERNKYFLSFIFPSSITLTFAHWRPFYYYKIH